MYSRQQAGIPGLTPMVKKILIATGIVYVLQLLIEDLSAYGGVSVAGVFQFGWIWQPATYMWLHSEYSPMHILLNMFMLYMFGGILESQWGSRKFLRFYLTTGIGAGLIILFWNTLIDEPAVTLGASGAIYGVITAFSLTWPDRTVMLLFPPIPMKAIWFIPLLFFFGIFFNPAGNVSHIGHLGGIIVAAILLRKEARRYFNLPNLRYRWHRYRMRGRLKAVRRDEWERRQKDDDKHLH